MRDHRQGRLRRAPQGRAHERCERHGLPVRLLQDQQNKEPQAPVPCRPRLRMRAVILHHRPYGERPRPHGLRPGIQEDDPEVPGDPVLHREGGPHRERRRRHTGSSLRGRRRCAEGSRRGRRRDRLRTAGRILPGRAEHSLCEGGRGRPRGHSRLRRRYHPRKREAGRCPLRGCRAHLVRDRRGHEGRPLGPLRRLVPLR